MIIGISKRGLSENLQSWFHFEISQDCPTSQVQLKKRETAVLRCSKENLIIDVRAIFETMCSSYRNHQIWIRFALISCDQTTNRPVAHTTLSCFLNHCYCQPAPLQTLSEQWKKNFRPTDFGHKFAVSTQLNWSLSNIVVTYSREHSFAFKLIIVHKNLMKTCWRLGIVYKQKYRWIDNRQDVCAIYINWLLTDE